MTEYQLDFQTLFTALGLGEIRGEPRPLTGGLLHRVFAVETGADTFAVKALNPEIMRRPNVLRNFIDSENIALLAARHIPAVPAIRFHGNAVQECGGQFYLLYRYIDGVSYPYEEVTAAQCTVIGSLLADLHGIDCSSLGLADEAEGAKSQPDWDDYLRRGLESNAAWVAPLRENLGRLKAWSGRVAASEKDLRGSRVIRHGDLESKNVIWKDGVPHLIDWEAADRTHPAYDLIETAMYWANDGKNRLDRAKFLAFVRAYAVKRRLRRSELAAALQKSAHSQLGWLAFSLNRSLGAECADNADRQLGTEQVFDTLDALTMHERSIRDITNWLAVPDVFRAGPPDQ